MSGHDPLLAAFLLPEGGSCSGPTELCARVSDYYILDRYPMVQEVELESGLLDRELTAAAELITRLHPGEPSR